MTWQSITQNPTIRHLWPIWQPLSPPHWVTVDGRPIVNLSLAVNYAISGFEVRGYHALNLTIHILAGLTLLAWCDGHCCSRDCASDLAQWRMSWPWQWRSSGRFTRCRPNR